VEHKIRATADDDRVTKRREIATDGRLRREAQIRRNTAAKYNTRDHLWPVDFQ